MIPATKTSGTAKRPNRVMALPLVAPAQLRLRLGIRVVRGLFASAKDTKYPVEQTFFLLGLLYRLRIGVRRLLPGFRRLSGLGALALRRTERLAGRIDRRWGRRGLILAGKRSEPTAASAGLRVLFGAVEIGVL